MDCLPRLFCLPPAGAGPSLYRPWAQHHRDTLDICPVALPGREARFTEPLPATLDQLADTLAVELAYQRSGDYAIFGYSMGAVLGYELARRWARQGSPPKAFFILASNAPDCILQARQPLHQLSHDAFLKQVFDLGGVSAELMNNVEAMALFEPILRNDFRICETYQHRSDGIRLDCPAYAFISESDALVEQSAARAWSRFFNNFTMSAIDGNHVLTDEQFMSIFHRVRTLYRPEPAKAQALTR